jgi:hypothetical protein
MLKTQDTPNVVLAVPASEVFLDELMHAAAAKEEQSWDAVVAFKEGQSCDGLRHR